MSFTVAILGRPNVGKSTLFNRLVGRRQALVDDRPGVTRDRREGEGAIADLAFRLIDTAGLEEAFDDSLEGAMRAQTERALEAADVALFLIDARAGLVPMDHHFADWLRRQPKPVLLVANKCEGKAGEAGLLDAYSLGIGDPIAVSAEHGEGMDGLYEALLPFERVTDDDELTDDGEGDDDNKEKVVKIAIVGRPNAGKSTLVNRLLGEERMLTGPEPGVTRDAIAVDWHFDGRRYQLVDTAGLRRKARVHQKLEKLSVADALRAINMAQVVVLLVDAEVPLERQDLNIAAQVMEEGRCLVVAVNKWDLIADPGERRRRVMEKLELSLPQARGVEVVEISALTGRGTAKLMPAVARAYARWNRRVPTAELNQWLAEVLDRHPPPLASGRRIKLRYMTQAKRRPPTFLLFTSRPADLPTSYLRYLTNNLRKQFDLPGVPIRIGLRKGKNPYA